MSTDDHKKFYGFTEDKVFGWVMEDMEFCRFVLQTVLPEIEIAKVENLYLQKELNNPDRESKDVRLDILVTDRDDRVYDVEMQIADEDNLGKRMRYYLSKVDAHYTLEKKKSYRDLKEAYIIFLCDFDFPGKGKLRYSYHEYEDQDRSSMLPTNSTKVIINAKGKLDGNSKDLQNLVKLMRGEKIVGSKHFDYAQKKIEEINEDPIRRDQIMDYETKMLEREQLGEEKGRREGEKRGEERGRREQSINLTENTVPQLKAKGFQRDEILDFIKHQHTGLSDEEIQKIVDKYYK